MLFYALGILTAGLIVAAQALWKAAVDKYGLELSGNFFATPEFWRLVTTPQVIGGVVLYGAATLCFLLMLKKFQYSSTQALVVSSSLVITMLVAAGIFQERITLVKIVGVGVLIIGVLLVTRS